MGNINKPSNPESDDSEHGEFEAKMRGIAQKIKAGDSWSASAATAILNPAFQAARRKDKVDAVTLALREILRVEILSGKKIPRSQVKKSLEDRGFRFRFRFRFDGEIEWTDCDGKKHSVPESGLSNRIYCTRQFLKKNKD